MKNLYCPLTGAYIPRFLPCVLIGFAFILGFNYIEHAKVLMSTYEQTPNLWRTPEDMNLHFKFLLLTQFLTAFLTAAIYTKGHEGKGACEGVRYGLLIGALMGVLMAAPYGWTPVSFDLAKAWFVGGLLEGLGLGILYSLIYKTPCCAKSACCAPESGKQKEGSCCEGKNKEKGSCGTGS